MKLKLIGFSLLLVLAGEVIKCNQTLASPVKEISVIQAQNSLDLEVSEGYGLTISFQKTGEKITQAWLADPSQIAFSTNAKNSSKNDSNPPGANSDIYSCQGGANVIFLRQIQPINFPNLTRSSDGGTQLVVLTKSREGQKQYIFRLLPVQENPEYTSIVLNPSQSEQQPTFGDSTNKFPTTSVEFLNNNLPK